VKERGAGCRECGDQKVKVAKRKEKRLPLNTLELIRIVGLYSVIRGSAGVGWVTEGTERRRNFVVGGRKTSRTIPVSANSFEKDVSTQKTHRNGC